MEWTEFQETENQKQSSGRPSPLHPNLGIPALGHPPRDLQGQQRDCQAPYTLLSKDKDEERNGGTHTPTDTEPRAGPCQGASTDRAFPPRAAQSRPQYHQLWPKPAKGRPSGGCGLARHPASPLCKASGRRRARDSATGWRAGLTRPPCVTRRVKAVATASPPCW